jgi:hypothetical protein
VSQESVYKVGPLRAEDPPLKVVRSSITAEILALTPQMKQQAMRWFRVAEFTNERAASYHKTNLNRRLPDVEWAARKIQGGSAIWGRWVGNGHKEKTQ